MIFLLFIFLLLAGQVDAAVISHSYLVGATTATTTRIWTRTDSAAAVKIQYQVTGGGLSSPSETSVINTVSGSDFTAIFDIAGLTANTTYDYRAVVDGTPSTTKTFKTFRTNGTSGVTKIAFGADLQGSPPFSNFDRVDAKGADALLLLGDNAYIDGASATESLWWTGYKAVRDSHMQAVVNHTPTFAVWDDHDYGDDNSQSNYAYKTTARAAMAKYWPNPNYVESNASIYYSFKIGDSEFWMLDERWNHVRGTTILGTAQDAWLKAGLLASTARFKFILSSTIMTNCSPTGSSDYDAFGYQDNAGVRAERDAIFQYIADNGITNVSILSGDAHWIGAFFHPFAGARIESSTQGFYEFSPTPLQATQLTTEPTSCNPDTKFFQADTINAFGVITIDTTSAPGSYTIQFFNADTGAQIYTRTVGEYFPTPAGTYYVSSGVGPGAQPAGSDSNPGTVNQPWQTLQRVFDTTKSTYLHGGETLILRGGEYDTAWSGVSALVSAGEVSIIPNGSDVNHMTTFKAFTGEKPVFRRYLPPGATHTEAQLQSSLGAHMPTAQECIDKANADGVAPKAFPWGCWSNDGYLQPGEQRVIVDPDIIDSHVMEIGAAGDNPYDGPFVEYIKFDGITFDARGIVKGVLQLNMSARHIVFDHFELANGVFGCGGNPVTQFDVNDSDRSLILDWKWLNGNVHHCGVPFDTNIVEGVLAREHPAARFYQSWYMHAGGVLWDGMEIHHIAGACASLLGQQNTFRNNYCHDNNPQSIIVSGYPISNANWQIYNNVFVTKDTCMEIQSLTDAYIFNNTCVGLNGPANGILLQPNVNPGANIVIENNIIVGYQTGINNWQDQGNGAVTVRNNLIQTVTPGHEIVILNGVTQNTSNNKTNVDPLFVDPSIRDYRIQSGSPAIDAGLTDSGLPNAWNGVTGQLGTDRLGNVRNSPPDIGAYEYCTGAGCTTPPTTTLLIVNSGNPSSGVTISYTVSNGTCTLNSPQDTQFSATCDIGASVALTAPAAVGSNDFSAWTGCDSTSGTGLRTCNVVITSARSVAANYSIPGQTTYTLTVNSAAPNQDVNISGVTTDNNGDSDGQTGFNRVYNTGTAVTVTAPDLTWNGNSFSDWSGCDSVSGTGNRTCNVTIGSNRTVLATFFDTGNGCAQDKTFTVGDSVRICGGPITVRSTPSGSATDLGQQQTDAIGTVTACCTTAEGFTWVQTDFATGADGYTHTNWLVLATGGVTNYTLQVNSTSAGGASVSVSPADNSGNTVINTPFALSYVSSTSVTLTAHIVAGSTFQNWTGCASTSGMDCTVTMDAAKTVTANYQTNVVSNAVTLRFGGSTAIKIGGGSLKVGGQPQ